MIGWICLVQTMGKGLTGWGGGFYRDLYAVTTMPMQITYITSPECRHIRQRPTHDAAVALEPLGLMHTFLLIAYVFVHLTMHEVEFLC